MYHRTALDFLVNYRFFFQIKIKIIYRHISLLTSLIFKSDGSSARAMVLRPVATESKKSSRAKYGLRWPRHELRFQRFHSDCTLIFVLTHIN